VNGGIDWTALLNFETMPICANGYGVVPYVDGIVGYSSNGLNWTYHYGGFAAQIQSAFYDGNQFVVTDVEGDIFTSESGKGWNIVSGEMCGGVEYIPAMDEYVGISCYGEFSTSTDLMDWNIGNLIPQFNIGMPSTLFYVDESYIVCFFSDINLQPICSISKDGNEWNLLINASDASTFAVSLAVSEDTLYAGVPNPDEGTLDVMKMEEGGKWGLLSQIPNGVSCSIIFAGEYFFCNCSEQSQVLSSPDGITWSKIQIHSVFSITYIDQLKEYAMPGDGVLWLSASLKYWVKDILYPGEAINLLVEGSSTLLALNTDTLVAYVSPI